MVSVIGLKVIVPAIARAVVNSGLATNANVCGLPSFRFAKFLLNEVTIEFFSPVGLSILFHIPMHGPQALVRTTPPKSSNIFNCPSRSIVARTCSLPGVMVNCDFAFNPFASACFARLAERSISS